LIIIKTDGTHNDLRQMRLLGNIR